ncbi:hypothetical protein UG55_1001123 [Frankia sp. EI5c]|uniref:hypothetical protein n=1 Tax=Frankia sp. EI5c TaxID=683316 RepID=UPI0007C3CC6D|nr:hypothetical protein [Frankia sp. EI5c]OAA29618.1 hypothetical protein UG55_1001123 [Frankia sp. EI5c]
MSRPPTPADHVLVAGWALMGKERGGYTDYVVLRSNEAYFSRSAYQSILHRYSPGTPPPAQRPNLPGALPWVTVSYAPRGRDGADTMFGIAERTWSDEVDASGRRVARTLLLCVPFSALAAAPVSYLGLHAALSGPEIRRATTADDPRDTEDAGGGGGDGDGGNERDGLPVAVSRLDPAGIGDYLARGGERLFLLAAETAALVLAGRVAILGAPTPGPDEPPAQARLRFLDAVAALLPYGHRARLTASTWAVSGAAHRIRLAFTDRPRPGDLVMRWRDPHEQPAELLGPPADYYNLLLRLRDQLAGSPADLVAHLARYRSGRRRVGPPEHAYFCLFQLTGSGVADAMGDLIARRLNPRRVWPGTESTEPAVREAAWEQAVEDAAGLVRAARDNIPSPATASPGRTPPGGTAAGSTGARTFDDELRARVAQVPVPGDSLVLELMRLAILDDVQTDNARPPHARSRHVDRGAAESTRRWLSWLEGAPELAERTHLFRGVLEGSPAPDVVAALDGQDRYLLSLSQLARLVGTSRALVGLLLPWLWRVGPTLSPRHQREWAAEIRAFRFESAGEAADHDLLLLMMGEAPGGPLRHRIHQMETDYVTALGARFADLVREQGVDRRVDRVLSTLARSVGDPDADWPKDPAKADLMLQALEPFVRQVRAGTDARRRPPGLTALTDAVRRYLRDNPRARRRPAGRRWLEVWLPTG